MKKTDADGLGKSVRNTTRRLIADTLKCYFSLKQSQHKELAWKVTSRFRLRAAPLIIDFSVTVQQTYPTLRLWYVVNVQPDEEYSDSYHFA